MERKPVVSRPIGRSQHTIRQYRRHVCLFAAWCADVRQSAAIESISHEDVARFLDLTATALGIALNRTADLAGRDEATLAKSLQELRAEDALDGVGYSEEDIDQLLPDLEEDLAGTSDVDDPGPEVPPENPVTKSGDLWTLGNHRLLCGDSAKPEDSSASWRLLFVLELSTRRVHVAGITPTPDSRFMLQVARGLTPRTPLRDPSVVQAQLRASSTRATSTRGRP